MPTKLTPLLVLAICGTVAAGPDVGKILFRERVLDHLQHGLTSDQLDRLALHFDEKNLYPVFVEALEQAYGPDFRQQIEPNLVLALYEEFLDGFARQFASIVDAGADLLAAESIVDCATRCLRQIDCGFVTRLGNDPGTAWDILPIMGQLANGNFAALGAAAACNGGEVVGCSIGCRDSGRSGGSFSVDCPIGTSCTIPDCTALDDRDPNATRWIPVGVCLGYGPGGAEPGLCCLQIGAP